MLDPAWSRVVLRDLGVAASLDLAGRRIGADRDRGGPGRAFVER